ncbi:MAG: iron chelate uptake ABC transporter family permease subunit [Gammaproteobacteria bacterium]
MIDLNWPDFLWRAVLGGVGIALVSGPLGVFLVWRRMSYFGDALAHAGLLGVSLALMLSWALPLGVLSVCLLLATLLAWLQNKAEFASDTLLGILSHTVLALGIIAVSMLEQGQVDILGYLYGDILAITWREIAFIYGGATLVLIALMKLWRPLLNLTVDLELAAVEGVSVEKVRWSYVMILALVVAVAIKMVGVLLITAMLVIPAAASRPFSQSPGVMAILSSVAGLFGVMAGIALSYLFDIPAGPAIVMALALFFFISLFSQIKVS